jgi:hypothetical protein
LQSEVEVANISLRPDLQPPSLKKEVAKKSLSPGLTRRARVAKISLRRRREQAAEQREKVEQAWNPPDKQDVRRG